MKRAHIHMLKCLLTLCVVLLAANTALAGDSAQVRMKDGSRWRGELGDQVKVQYVAQGVEQQFTGELAQVKDLYIIIEGTVAGKPGRKLIYIGDIRSMETVDDTSASSSVETTARNRAKSTSKSRSSDDAAADSDLGVFVLPLEGGVGQEIRHHEIKELGEYADRYGPGQIIVLIINTNGGLVLESNRINDTIMELKKRHRVVAWIQKAISAGASTAMACDEIYFMTEGSCGSVTTVRGTESVPEEEIRDHIRQFAEMAEANGISPHIARAMKLNKYMCSYDKDPETGEVTFYGDLSGEYVLSDAESNLAFNSSNALHCGFSDGTADTGEDLAKLLDLPRWHEKSDYGRQIAAQWQRTVKQAKREIPRLLTRLNYAGSAGGFEERIGAQIQIFNELIRWCERAELIALFNFGLDKAQLERQVEELRKQLADYRRQQNGRR